MRRADQNRIFEWQWTRQITPKWTTHQTHHYASGREALLALLASWSKPGHVLLPTPTPEGLYLPFAIRKWAITFYNVDQFGNPDWPDIEQRVKASSFDLAVIIHLFGISRDHKRFRALLSSECLLLEDFAHHCQLRLSPNCDYQLYSPTKLFGLLDGAILVQKTEAIAPQKGQTISRHKVIYLFWRTLELSAATAQHLTAWKAWNRIMGGARRRAYDTLLAYLPQIHQMSACSRWLYKHRPQAKAIQRRKELATYYATHLVQPLLRPLTPEQTDEALFGLPFSVKERAAFLTFCAKHGYTIMTLSERWWFAPDTEEYAASRAFHDSLVLLPLHHKLNIKDVKAFIEVVNAFKP